jgi:TonB family protein
MTQLRRVALLLCALACTHVTTAAAADAAPPLGPDGIQSPERVRLNVNWPGLVDREALVRVRFRVHADGHVSEVELMDGGFHEKRFVDEVFRAMKTAKFKPAMKNGVPLDDYCATQPVVFSLGAEAKGITVDFRSELNKVEKLVRSGDNAGAHFHAEWMLSEKAKLLYEYAALQAQLAYTHASVGNVHRAIAAAHAGSERKSPTQREFSLEELAPPNSFSYYMLPKEVVTNLLEMRFRLAATKGMLLESILAYQELAGLVKIPADDPRARTAVAIVTALKGEKPLVAQLRVDEQRFVAHELFRRTFSIAPRTGSIDKVFISCAGHNRQLAYQPGVEWTIPAKWEKCAAAVQAEPGTEFEFVEYTPGTDAIVLPEG